MNLIYNQKIKNKKFRYLERKSKDKFISNFILFSLKFLNATNIKNW